MQIKQLANRKIQFWEGGYIQFSCLPGQNYKVINKQEIQVLTISQKPFSLFAKDIEFTAILGGVLTAVSFADSQELAEYLDLNFFFELSDGGGADNLLSGYGDTGEYNQTHYAFPFILTSTALSPGLQYTIPIFLGGLYDEFALYQISAIVGKFNFAIYDGKTGAGQAFVPDQKVFQSPEFTTVAAATKIQLFNPATNFEQGQYFFSIIADSAFTFQGARIAGSYLGYASLPAFVLITRYITTGIYAATLPATFPPYFNDLANPANPVLWHKKTL